MPECYSFRSMAKNKLSELYGYQWDEQFNDEFKYYTLIIYFGFPSEYI